MGEGRDEAEAAGHQELEADDHGQDVQGLVGPDEDEDARDQGREGEAERPCHAPPRRLRTSSGSLCGSCGAAVPVGETVITPPGAGRTESLPDGLILAAGVRLAAPAGADGARGAEATPNRVAGYCWGWVAIWIRLPQVSSKTAVVTGPISRGSWVKRTPRARRRSYSAGTSSTAN